MPGSSIFIFGLGYVGQQLGLSMQAEGWQVAGTTRTIDNAQKLERLGFYPMIWPDSGALTSTILNEYKYILVTIPPDEHGDVVLRQINFAKITPTWIGYLSATSVYGDYAGEWVTEDSPLRPGSTRGKQRLIAELQWLKLFGENSAFPLHIFRLGGIYGPQRSVLDTIHKGFVQRIAKPGHVFSRIHINDIVEILKASMAKPQPGEIYNLADDEPASTADVIAYGCQLLGKEIPSLTPFDQANISLEMQGYYAENKRVSNNKIKEQLGINLQFPTYREGLKYCSSL